MGDRDVSLLRACLGYMRAVWDARSLRPTVRSAAGLDRQRSMTLMEWVNYHQHQVIPRQCTWRGVRTLKNPLDVWVYQEIIQETRPDVILEIGNKNGGSTLVLADLCELMGHGQVIGIDIDHSVYDPRARHERITLITGSSGDADVVAKVKALCAGKSVLIIHDGLHTRDAVLRDLEAYGPLVPPGGYLIVEDTTDDLRGFIRQYPAVGFRRFADYCAGSDEGALAAVDDFLKRHGDFEIDKSREKYILTTNVNGYLRRRAD